MQITLVQTEVEQALRDYVASRLTLAEGTTFSIDLAATRGANGITATIDLIEPGQVAPTAVAQVTRSTNIKPVAVAAVKAVSEVQPDPATQASAAQENAATAQETGSVVQEAEAGQVTGEAEQTEATSQVEAAPATTPKSLFGGLQRPKNS
jgi:hypothetical protein